MKDSVSGADSRLGIGILFSIPRIRNALLFRSFALWFAIRLAAAFGGLGFRTAIVSMGIVLVVGGIVLLEARRRDEDLFLANLGVSSLAIFAVGLPVPMMLELLILTIAR